MGTSVIETTGPPERRSRAFHVTILALFFVSGTAGLIYQVLWARLLTLSFGVTVLAASTVIAAFMGGLALGSYLFGRWADRFGNGRVGWGLKVFALLQVGIGLYAAAFPLLLGLGEAVIAPLYRWQPPPTVFHLSRFLVTFLLLLVPTTLMGGTLPVLVRVLCRGVREAGWQVGLLYGINTAGAVVGVALAGFWMAAALGTTVSTRLAASANVAVALVAWLLARSPARGRRPAPTPAPAPVGTPAQEGYGGPPALVRLVLVVTAASGFAALSYEVLWFRLLTVVTQDYSTYSFAAMLTTFLAGLAVGSWLWGWLLRRLRRPVLMLGVIEVAIGVLGLLSVGYFLAVQQWYTSWGLRLAWRRPAVAMMAGTAVALFLPVTLMGGALPVAVHAVTRRLSHLGRSVGTVYAANTLGAIAGAFVPIFILIPTVGTQTAVLLTAGVNLVAGLALLAWAPRTTRSERVIALVGSLVLAGAALALVPANSFRTIFERALPSADRQLLYYRDGITGTVTIHQTVPLGRVLSINGLPEVPTDYGSLRTFRVMGHVPMLLHPNPQRALSITFGGGIVAGAMAQHQPEVLDAVDLSEGVFDAARLFSKENQQVLDYPGLRIFVNDARNFIAYSRDTYDVIISDCSHPKSGDSWVLFTREFYQDLRRRLSSDGVFAQFILIHRLTYQEFRSLLGTIQETFPHTTVWVAGPYALVVSTVGPFTMDYGRISRALQQPKVKASLAPFGMDDPAALLGNFVLDETAVADLVRGAPINVEDRPFVGLSNLWVGGTVPVTLRHVFARRTPLGTALTGLPSDPEQATRTRRRLERAALAHPHAVWTEFAYSQGRLGEAGSRARAALELNPQDPDARHFLAAARADLERKEQMARAQVRAFPKMPSSYRWLAQAAASRGDMRAAAEALERTIRLGLDTLKVREQLGAAYLGLGEGVGAARQFRKALGLKPRSTALRVSLARALLLQGRQEEAEQLLREALKRDPDNLAAHETLGVMLLGQDRPVEAQKEFEAMLRGRHELASPYLHLARSYQQRQLLPQAITSYRFALESDPYMLPAYLGLVRLLGLQDDWSAARQVVLRALEFLPTSGELLAVLGDLSLAAGELPQAENAYRRALNLNRGFVPAYAGLAQVSAARGDLETARRYWQEVLRRDPQDRFAEESLRRLGGRAPEAPAPPLPPGPANP